ncbi:TonB-dependent siderophore receptor [Ottowia testudinis]|uniref:TonB-dependent siderophore receptor n=1 Tax=Ottowia testudinis TaxID=2816950 RepID=A0A975H4H1_9BURK|nr:TonB-dependent siderophore receptor [Ottowia testudinis]QTD46365.1 TonB-dependent siderophore receptor [Ottowia testudinis]
MPKTPFSLVQQAQAATLSIASGGRYCVLCVAGALAGASATAQTDPFAPAVTLPDVQVRAGAEAEASNGPVQGYAAQRSASATKTDTPLLESPQAISVVGREQMQAQGADSVLSSLRYTPGVAIGNQDADIWESFYLRGFKARRARRDGMLYQTDAWDGRQEPYGIERVEVLKGPASVMFGGDEPGGQINTISKLPTPEPVREVHLELGQWGHRMLGVDHGGALNADKTSYWRLVAAARDRKGWISGAGAQRFYLAPSWTWQPNADTRFTLMGEFQRDHATPLEYGVPAQAALRPPPALSVPRGFFAGEPGFDDARIRRASVGWRLSHRFQPGWTLHHAARYLDVGTHIQYTNSDALLPDGRTLQRTKGTRMQRGSAQWVTDNFLQADWRTPGIEHQSIVGFDYASDRLSSQRWDVPITSGGALDVFDPVHGQAVYGAAVPHRGSRHEVLRQGGFYLQDQMKIQQRWAVTVGLRHGWASWGERPYDKSKPYDLSRASALTGRAGVVYLADGGWAPYASWSQSFKPQGGTDRQGRRFSPARGEQFEVGLRYQPPGQDMLLTASAYHLSKTNVLTPDPVDRSHSVQTGKVVVKGLELEAQARLTRGLGVTAGYGYTDARVAASNRAAEVGQRVRDIPRHQFSIWADQKLTALNLPAWTLGLGVRHVGAVNNPDHTVPAYTVVDAMLRYQQGPWRAQLNVKNLGNRHYVESCAYACALGQPLTAQLSVNYAF